MKKNIDAVVSYTAEELTALPRLAGTERNMTDAEITAAALADPDTAHQLLSDTATRQAETVSLADIFSPQMVEELGKRHRGRPKSDKPKVQFTVRFDAEIVQHFRNGGPGWQVRMEETLRKAISAGL